MPDLIEEIRRRLEGLNLGAQGETEIADEIGQHLQDRYRELRAAGRPESEALADVFKEAGDLARLARELCRVVKRRPAEPVTLGAASGIGVFSGLTSDVRSAARSLAGAKSFTVVAVLCLALGIGGATTIFSVVRPVLLRPLHYPHSERLVELCEKIKFGDMYTDKGMVSGPVFLSWKANVHSLDRVEAFTAYDASLTGGQEPLRVHVAQTTPGLFSLLGAIPAKGRLLTSDDPAPGNILFSGGDAANGSSVAVISDRLWRTEFGSDPRILGRTARLDGGLFTIAGVMRGGFDFPEKADLWMPAALSEGGDNGYLNVVGLIRGGVSLESARAELAGISDRVAKEGGRQPSLGVSVIPLHDFLVGEVRQTLIVLFFAVVLVLLIACANVAGLLVARGASRQKDVAIRISLGASRLRIVRQLLVESVLVALASGAAGTAFAFGGLTVFLALAPANIPGADAARIDIPVLAFALSASLFTGLLFGIAPAWLASSGDINASLKESGAGRSATAGRSWLRSAFVVSEVALAVILLAGSGLMIRSFVLLQRTKLGFNTSNVTALNVALPLAQYRKPEQMTGFYQQALRNIESLPGRADAAIVSALPLANGGMRVAGDFVLEGQTQAPTNHLAAKLAVSPTYFQTMGIPLVEGRGFADADRAEAPGVVIVSAALAKEVWPTSSPLGKRINIGFENETPRTIVGVVGDVCQEEVDGKPKLAIYQPFTQVPRLWQLWNMAFVVRSDVHTESRIANLVSAIQAADKDVPVYGVETIDRVVADKETDPRFYTSVLAALSGLALILAATGVYGIVSYSVGQRTQEIGIRSALGANQSEVVGMFLKRGCTLVLFGLGLGIGASYGLTRFIASFLYQTTPTDTATFAAISVLLLAIASLASYIPARAAARVDPVTALRVG